MITSPLPEAIEVHPAKESPTLAAGRPLIVTVLLPELMDAECVPQRRPPGFLCDVDVSPTRAAARPLINTSPLPLAMVKPLQCTTPESPCLAAAGMLYLHQSSEPRLPGLDLFMLLVGMWRGRYLWQELDQVIEIIWDVLIALESVQVGALAHHESMGH